MDKPLKDFSALNQKKEQIRKCITKIMNTLSFRKLAGKTQVILSLTGPDVRTRLTHTIEVARIAKDICFELGLNEDLAEAMALAHDIGHTPFGHVGERTLRDIMCGCDTLGDKVQDCDFDNSGFKHNLQSFRVLIDLERINNDSNGKVEYKNIWPYIIWGALAHTKMTYAKSYSGMDDEILISSKHCDWVYVCYHHDKKECKRNIHKKKEKERKKKVKKKEICKPWYCAKLPVLKDREKIDEKLLNIDETTREYIKKEPIERIYVDEKIYCSHKCYLAKLWENKIDNENKSIYKTLPYLFDHPFPNTFYAKSLNNYFSNPVHENNLRFISFEARIVSQADEIAQRQQDLEDGINKGLLPFETAVKEVGFLIEEFNCSGKFKEMTDEIENIDNSKDLGKLLAEFYKKAIVNQTLQNVNDFFSNTDKVKINIYSLMDILYSMNDNTNKEKWILEEFKALGKSSGAKDRDEIKCLEHYFEIDFDPVYLYLLSYDHLEKCTKRHEHSALTIDIMSKCIDSLNVPIEDLSESGAKDFLIFKNNLKALENNRFEFDYGFIRTLDLLRNYFFKHYQAENDDFFKMKNEKWKTIGWLKLRSFYSLYHIVIENRKNNNVSVVTIADLVNFNAPIDYKPAVHAVTAFNNWKKVLKHDANKVLANLVTFTDKNNHDYNREQALGDFEEDQSNAILKSEPVEKNDGKAKYILRRLFKAYITNSHQLPDLGLRYILISLIRDGELTEVVKSEKKACKEILDKLKKTSINITGIDDNLKKIWQTGLLNFETDDKKFKKLQEGKSNEIKAALEKRKELAGYFKELNECRDEVNQKLNSEEEEGKNLIKEQLRNLRTNLDNPILNKTRYWESIMTRGICDYIAALTDQEAINEYEKLYTGIMELV